MSQFIQIDKELASTLITEVYEVLDERPGREELVKAIVKASPALFSLDVYVGFGEDNKGSITVAIHELDMYLYFPIEEVIEGGRDDVDLEKITKDAIKRAGY